MQVRYRPPRSSCFYAKTNFILHLTNIGTAITNPENSIFLAICSVTFALYFIGRDQLYCGPHEFMCLHAQKCIPIQLRCDRENDCNDWEDEINCTGCKLFVIIEVVS